MTTSIDSGSTPASASSRSPARTDRSLTCSSGAAMCLPRSPNFSTSTVLRDAGRAGELGRGHPAAPGGTKRSRRGRRASLRGSRTAADDALELARGRARGTLAVPPQRIQRRPISSPRPISAHAATSGRSAPISPRSDRLAERRDVAAPRRGRSGSGASRARRTRPAG